MSDMYAVYLQKVTPCRIEVKLTYRQTNVW